jgi:hypothetical protein
MRHHSIGISQVHMRACTDSVTEKYDESDEAVAMQRKCIGSDKGESLSGHAVV